MHVRASAIHFAGRIFLQFVRRNPRRALVFLPRKNFQVSAAVRASHSNHSEYDASLLVRFARVIHCSPSASVRFVKGCVIFCIKVREIIQCRDPAARFPTPRVRAAAKNASFAYPLLALLITHDGEKSFLPTYDLHDPARLPDCVIRVPLHFRLCKVSR